MIDASVINAFVQAVEKVFATMLQTEVVVREPALRSSNEPNFDVSGIIGLSGDMVGVIVLSFPIEVAERVASLFCGAQVTAQNEDFADAIGELVNMVSGNAKGSFQSHKTSISCPTVVVGRGHQVFGRRDVPCIELPCSCDCGDFIVEIALRDVRAESQNVSDRAALSA